MFLGLKNKSETMHLSTYLFLFNLIIYEWFFLFNLIYMLFRLFVSFVVFFFVFSLTAELPGLGRSRKRQRNPRPSKPFVLSKTRCRR